MSHRVAPLPFKPDRLNGLSDRLLESHYENNYGGAVRRLNAIESRLATLDWGSAPVFEINGLKREELIAANSMILHEIYFDGLGGDGDPAGELAAAIERDFGNVAKWKVEFISSAKAQAGGSGWMLLTWSPRHGRLVNQWAADHTHGIAGGTPILALDMYEHSYHLDFGAKAAAYVDAVMANIDWGHVGARYERLAARRAEADPPDAAEVPSRIAAEDLRDRLARGDKLLIIDVRLQRDLDRARDQLPGAIHRDSEQIDAWAYALPRDAAIVLYCAHGFRTSQGATSTLQTLGLDAHVLAGGISSWRAIGAATVPLSMTDPA